ncbi:hypothetical protein CHELA1G11_13031 [Hyphomicrobiales bacterium]|nr:hypothetical protein CHELA1G2_11279 [Hyphomicrobiales bacterium]CAH1668822.1 hypothetical protein CHELA1G11_13031 [Hyphomicrobiales bacterium]
MAHYMKQRRTPLVVNQNHLKRISLMPGNKNLSGIPSDPSGYNIEKNIPMPMPGGSRRRYPFYELNVGESFHISGSEKDMQAVRVAACHYGRRHGRKFTVRAEDEGGRCWRIA